MPITRIVERHGEPREPAADLSEADDQQRLAAEFVLSLREVADHTAPDPFCLIVARLGKPARERQHQCHNVLGDRAGIDAAGAREPHPVLLERLTRKLIGAGTDRLDEAQPFRPRQEIVAPEPRDHQHVGLPLERGAIAHLEALDAGRDPQEALAQPIGNMRKTDCQLILGRKHKVTSEFVSYDAMSAVQVLLRAEGTRAHITARLTRNAHMACFGTNLGVGCPGAPWRALLQTESHAP
jgi:hypothetical protein